MSVSTHGTKSSGQPLAPVARHTHATGTQARQSNAVLACQGKVGTPPSKTSEGCFCATFASYRQRSAMRTSIHTSASTAHTA